jgi:hypothetical protein
VSVTHFMLVPIPSIEIRQVKVHPEVPFSYVMYSSCPSSDADATQAQGACTHKQPLSPIRVSNEVHHHGWPLRKEYWYRVGHLHC